VSAGSCHSRGSRGHMLRCGGTRARVLGANSPLLPRVHDSSAVRAAEGLLGYGTAGSPYRPPAAAGEGPVSRTNRCGTSKLWRLGESPQGSCLGNPPPTFQARESRRSGKMGSNGHPLIHWLWICARRWNVRPRTCLRLLEGSAQLSPRGGENCCPERHSEHSEHVCVHWRPGASTA
ncbi:unnamed protein product, partial [Symbiodinium microadriaticum]